MTKANLLYEAETTIRALRLGAVSEPQFVLCMRNAIGDHLASVWLEAGAPYPSVNLFRIIDEARLSVQELVEDVTDEGAVSLTENLGWWYDNTVLTATRAAALDGMVANETVYYFGEDFRITEQDVNEAIHEAGERVGTLWAAMMEPEVWGEQE